MQDQKAGQALFLDFSNFCYRKSFWNVKIRNGHFGREFSWSSVPFFDFLRFDTSLLQRFTPNLRRFIGMRSPSAQSTNDIMISGRGKRLQRRPSTWKALVR
jgi:hypothetical protein